MLIIPLVNKKVPSLMNNENNGDHDWITIMTEFVGLRVKMYAVLWEEGRQKVSNVIARSITFNDYMQCLHKEIEMKRQQSRTRSKLHVTYTISETKIALNLYDNKVYCTRFYWYVSWAYYKILLWIHFFFSYLCIFFNETHLYIIRLIYLIWILCII